MLGTHNLSTASGSSQMCHKDVHGMMHQNIASMIEQWLRNNLFNMNHRCVILSYYTRPSIQHLCDTVLP